MAGDGTRRRGHVERTQGDYLMDLLYAFWPEILLTVIWLACCFALIVSITAIHIERRRSWWREEKTPGGDKFPPLAGGDGTNKERFPSDLDDFDGQA